MKIHKISRLAPKGVDFNKWESWIYIPDKGILAYYDIFDAFGDADAFTIGYFSDKPELLKYAQNIVESKIVSEKVMYEKESELDDEVVSQLISAGKNLNKIKEDFNTKATSLIRLVE